MNHMVNYFVMLFMNINEYILFDESLCQTIIETQS